MSTGDLSAEGEQDCLLKHEEEERTKVVSVKQALDILQWLDPALSPVGRLL